MLCLNVTRGCGDHSPLTRPKEEVTHFFDARRKMSERTRNVLVPPDIWYHESLTESAVPLKIVD